MAEVGKIFLLPVACMAVSKNSEVKKCCGMEEGSVSKDFKDDFVKKQGWKNEVKVD